MKGKIFNAQEVQAIINGSKVMFREVIKPQPFQSNSTYQSLSVIRDCPYQAGQKIFCKETFSYSNQPWCDKTIFYKASHGDRIQHTFSVSQRENKWRSPMVMQEYDSRLTPLIKSIGVERLGEISEEDCIKEGMEDLCAYQDFATVCKLAKELGERNEDARPNFAAHWNATHKKPEEKFEANPWVWVCTMEVVK